MPTETRRSEPYPFHYTASGAPCAYSGREGWIEGQTCPDGCDSARTHYANDGHPGCDSDPDDAQ